MQIGERAQLEWHRFADFAAEDLYELLRFRQAIFVVEQASPYPDLDGRDQYAEHLLLRIDGDLAGYLRLISDPENARVMIGRVAVAPPWRRQGLARRLTVKALDHCCQDYPDCAITLSAQTYLAPFYESLGFHPTSLPYEDYGVPHVEMRRETQARLRQL